MIEVDAVVWYWSANGMMNFPQGPGLGRMGYIERTAVERLLEEAYLRGQTAGLNEAREIVRTG